MRRARTAAFQAMLRGRLAEIDAAAAAASDDLSAVARDRADGAADDEHDPEGVPLSEEWARADGMRRALEAERRAVEEALARGVAGTYGVCVECGRDIPDARLEALPQSALCVSCAERRSR